jgi:hypothetical protein
MAKQVGKVATFKAGKLGSYQYEVERDEKDAVKLKETKVLGGIHSRLTDESVDIVCNMAKGFNEKANNANRASGGGPIPPFSRERVIELVRQREKKYAISGP